MGHGHHGHHGHHHGHGGGCGWGGCGWGWGGWGWGGYGLPLLAAAPAYAPGYAAAPMLRVGADPAFGGTSPAAMMPASAAAMTVAQPVAPQMVPQVLPPAAPVQVPLVTPAQALLAGYIQAKNAAGFPTGTAIAPLGFRSKKIRKHKRRTVVARPETVYSPRTILIPRHVARHFEICSIRVGTSYVFGSRDGIPAEFYANEGLGPMVIQLPPNVIPGQHIYMTVKNRSGKSRHFRAALNGIEVL